MGKNEIILYVLSLRCCVHSLYVEKNSYTHQNEIYPCIESQIALTPSSLKYGLTSARIPSDRIDIIQLALVREYVYLERCDHSNTALALGAKERG